VYSPDGFASLACLMVDQCWFLAWQQPFIELMRLFHGNYIAFFLLQAVTWFAIIGSIYFLARELKVKHLFLTPFLLLFGGGLFVDNYVGGFENDYVAIVLFVVAMFFWFRKKHYLNKWISLCLVGLGTSIWMWVAYFRMPLFFEDIAEMNWWVQIGAWGFILPIYLFALYCLIKKKWGIMEGMFLLSFIFPKLWFFSIPFMLQTIDFVLCQLDFKKNYRFYMSCIVCGLLIGQVVRVGVNTYLAWSYTQESDCYTVNHEYLARIQGKVLYTNQASIYEYNECLKAEGSDHG
jgi:hypothetical protein